MTPRKPLPSVTLATSPGSQLLARDPHPKETARRRAEAKIDLFMSKAVAEVPAARDEELTPVIQAMGRIEDGLHEIAVAIEDRQ
jgi:hypothetical protein